MRPAIWIGHVHLTTNSVKESRDFMIDIGVRPIFSNDKTAVMELRGGTHLILVQSDSKKEQEAGFDFMVEALDDTYSTFKAKGLEVSEIQRGNIHDSFDVTEPGGNRIRVNSTHVEDHNAV